MSTVRTSDARAVHEFFRYWYEWVRSPARRHQVETLTDLPESAAMILRRVQYHGPLSVSDLARSFGLDTSTISRQLEPLRAGRLIDESPARHNKRVSQIVLSRRGAALCDRLDRAQVQFWSSVLSHLPPAQQRTVSASLVQLQHAMDVHGATVPPDAVG